MIDLKISINGTTQPIKKLVVEFYENGEVKTNSFNNDNSNNKVNDFNNLMNLNETKPYDRFSNVSSVSNSVTNLDNTEELPDIEFPDIKDREVKVSNTMNEEF